MQIQRMLLAMIAMILGDCVLIGRVNAADTAPDANCPVCGGLGIVPNVPYKPYVQMPEVHWTRKPSPRI